MNSRGQVFTLDVLFALILVTLIIGFSGQALEQMTGKAEGYSARFSLERTANDAADVLVKTYGKPYNWENNFGTLETLGLTEMDKFTGKPLQNNLCVEKLARFKALCKSTNWDPSKPEVNAAMEFFGSSSNFEIKVIDGATDNVMWDIWPRWDNGSSGVENSLEVAVVRREVTVKYGEIRMDTGEIFGHKEGGNPGLPENWGPFTFTIGPDELEMYDWYIIATTDTSNGISSADMWVNRPLQGNSDYTFRPNSANQGAEVTFPDVHGGLQVALPGRLHEGSNYIMLKTVSKPGTWADIYVVIVPHCTPVQNFNFATIQNGVPGALELKLWR
jgi:hypothetical protein